MQGPPRHTVLEVEKPGLPGILGPRLPQEHGQWRQQQQQQQQQHLQAAPGRRKASKDWYCREEWKAISSPHSAEHRKIKFKGKLGKKPGPLSPA